MRKILTNGFLLLIPIFVWNLLFYAKLPLAGYTNDEPVARWLIVAETILRIVVFTFPLLLTMRLETPMNKLGLFLYLFGCLIYFSAWLVEIYAPETAVADHPFIILAPYYTPLIFMCGIGLMGSSMLYLVFAAIFTGVHTCHGVLSFGYVSPF
jgi:hypothetical protein